MADILSFMQRNSSARKPILRWTALFFPLLLFVPSALLGPKNATAEEPNSSKPSGGESAAMEPSLDLKPILNHNQAWLHPTFNALKSVSFRFATEPKRLVEAFDWRADGASLLELLEYPDWNGGVGRRELTMPDGAYYLYLPESKFGEPKSAPDGGSERYFREHLRGVHTNFMALDWGVEPEQFPVRKVRSNADGTLAVTLVPERTPYQINVGVMFHYSSWAYLHDLGIALAELKIDPATHRILREIDYNADGERLVEIEFSDWKNVANDREVPLSIHVSTRDKSRVEVDYRFQWREEGLWILKNSSGALDGKDPQHGEIVDLTVNQATPRLDHAIELFEQSQAILQEPTATVKKITLQGLYPFELGKNIALQKIEPEQFPTAKNLLFAFDLDDPSAKYNHHVEMTAEIDFERLDPAKMGDKRLLLTFLDQYGLPIQGHYASLSTLAASDQSAQKIAENLRKANAMWLSPLRKEKFSYALRQDSKTKRISIDENSPADDRLGFLLTTSFDDFLRSPEAYRIPVQFEGVLDGKPVVFAGFCGNSLDHRYGGQGYMSFLNSSGLVLFEKETWRPLVVRVGYLEIQYLDYVDVEPGVSVPLRIVVADKEGDMRSDFRYKVMDGKLWLFDRNYSDGKIATSTDDVLWSDGKAAKTTSQSTVEGIPLKELKLFDFRRIADRRAADAQDSATLLGIMAQGQPWEYPGYDDLMKTVLLTDKQSGTTKLHMNLGPAEQLKDASYIALTWLSSQGALTAIPGPRQAKVNAYLLPPGEIAKVKLLDATSPKNLTMAFGMISAEMKKEAASYEAKVEFLDTTQYKGLFATLSLAIVDPQGVILSAGWRNHSFANYQGVYSSEQLLHLGRTADVQPLYLIPRYDTVVYARMMGSALGTTSEPYKPPLTWEQILSAEDNRQIGSRYRNFAQQLQSTRLFLEFMFGMWRVSWASDEGARAIK